MIQKVYLGAVGALVLAAAGAMAISNTPSRGDPVQQPGAASIQARCDDAARQMQALFTQIKGLEGVLNRKQEELNAAKGTDARLDAAVGMVNELSDSRVKIREKEESMRDLLVGHMLEHLTNRAQNRELELQSCTLFKDLRRSVDQQIQRGDQAQQRDRERPQPK
jgi:hypothetical protein